MELGKNELYIQSTSTDSITYQSITLINFVWNIVLKVDLHVQYICIYILIKYSILKGYVFYANLIDRLTGPLILI